MVSTASPRPSRLRSKPLAKLEGKVFLPDRDVPFKHFIRRHPLLMGRSDHTCTDTHPFKPAKEGVDVGLGVSNKLSRLHARIEYSGMEEKWQIVCLGKNGLAVASPGNEEGELKLSPEDDAVELKTKSVIKIADCVLVFTLHKHLAGNGKKPDKSESANELLPLNSKKRKKRLWIKSEHSALRAAMMRLGYGRWHDIIANASGRLSERDPAELVPVARDFVAHCFVHARPGVEQKALMDILREEPLANAIPEDRVENDILALVESMKKTALPDEKRKYVRWARKLRLLSRLRDVHDHPSLERLRKGELKVFTPPPALYWTSADDADLITGSYNHGYGYIEAMRMDPNLGFFGRYAKPLPVKKPTPSKDLKAANGTSAATVSGPAAMDTMNVSEEDDEDDVDEDEDEDERHGASKEEDEENGHDSIAHPRKRMKLGNCAVKKDDCKPDRLVDDSDVSPNTSPLDHKPDPDDSEKNSDIDPIDASEQKVQKKPVRMVPKRGPRIGNEDGFNEPEDAQAAREKMADEEGLVPFPSSESLMRRLKSIINSCAKEFDRDQRELKKKRLAESRAKQRKDDLAARKKEKEEEKSRQREERRIQKSQPFSKKEAVEFEKALANFGVGYEGDAKTVDWSWFHSKVDGFEAKYADTLNAAYIELLGEAHRISDIAAAKEDEDYVRVESINEAKPASAVFTTLTQERAERLIERLQFFRVLRGEVLAHKNINSILRGFKKTKDLPLWWKSSHDRSLLLGVDRHGLNGWDFMGVDSELLFANSMKSWQRKNGNDLKSLKRAAMPKPSVGIKRAFNLVRYFRSRANDPHFEHYAQDAAASSAVDRERETIVEADTEPVTPFAAKEEDKPMIVDDVEDTPKSEPGSRVVDAPKGKRKGEALFPAPSTGRPRTLRETIVPIPRDADGMLMLPTDLGDGLFLLSLGEIRENVSGFCRNGILYPVGFRTVRQIGSNAILCEILESDDGMNPEFRVSALEGFDPSGDSSGPLWADARVIALSPNIVTLWLRVVNELNKDDLESYGRVALASGPERFGLYEPTIVYHIQKLPGARSVKGFELRDFSRVGGGKKVEATVGVMRGMLNGIAKKLEKPEAVGSVELVTTGQDEGPRERLLLADSEEMSVPEEWVEKYSGDNKNKKKNRRKSNSYWG